MEPSADSRNNKPPLPRRGQKTGKKIPKRITADYLHNSGLYYLQRYAASSGHFREVMLRKVKRSCQAHPDQNYADCAALVDELVAKFVRSGLLNDDLYVRGVVSSLRRRGTSKQAIMGKLRMKAVTSDLAETHLEECDEDFAGDEGNGDFKAALIFARRKKLGPFAGDKEEEPQKILAKFARAGFSYDIATKVMRLEADDIEALL
ncbi:MAG: RecX family transcriptional regulator [Alphaproteobacteria bacterium]|nr:RecX family transcriptional regulator [Alphaproteobacteria bacterium]